MTTVQTSFKAIALGLFAVCSVVGVGLLSVGFIAGRHSGPWWPAVLIGLAMMVSSFAAFRIARHPTLRKIVVLFIPAISLVGLMLWIGTLPE